MTIPFPKSLNLSMRINTFFRIWMNMRLKSFQRDGARPQRQRDSVAVQLWEALTLSWSASWADSKRTIIFSEKFQKLPLTFPHRHPACRNWGWVRMTGLDLQMWHLQHAVASAGMYRAGNNSFFNAFIAIAGDKNESGPIGPVDRPLFLRLCWRDVLLSLLFQTIQSLKHTFISKLPLV